jgi:tetratricopeptide (TPR) repeat protein
LSYQGRSVWDQLQETVVEVRPGTPPQLTARRYYRYEADGLKLLVRIDNKGDRTARDVCYEEEIFVKGEPQPVRLTFRGDLPGAEVGQIIEHRLNVNDHTLILIPERSEITYRDSRGKRESIALDPVLKRIEYDFPQTPTSTRLVGRDEEVLRITDFIHQIVQAQRNRNASNLKRLLFIEGIEGAGKTRLVHELSRQAEGSGFRCFLEDGKDRSPVKRMLRRLLGLRPDEDTDRIIWDRLKEHFDKEQNPQREVVYQLISTVPTRLEQDGLDSLAAGVLVLIKKLCKGWPTLLVFENIQWIPEGLEEQLIIRLFQDTLSSTGEPILLCATYRPMHTGAPPTVSKLKMSSDRYETIRLGAISEKAARALVDQIVTFPKLSEPLYDFVLKWSHNNPLYLIEILRLLLQPDSAYITRVGGVWHPAPGTRLEEAVPESIEKVILARVEQELPSEMEFLKVLSAIGFELPLALVEGLIHTEFPEWSSNELYTHLELLVKAGLLAKQSRDAAASGDYEFEHHIKREVLYQTLPEGMRSHLSERVAEILLSQTIFSDPDEQARQLARHLVKSRRQFREAHLEEIVKAAELERDMCNFSKSLQFYDAALELLPESGSRQGSHNTHKLVTLLLERSRLNQMRGYLIPAERDLEQAHDLLSRHRNSAKSRDPQAKRLSIKVDKERGRVMSKQPHAILERANEFLYRARVGMEGILRLRRFFPPKDKEFYQDLVEIYLALAEIWLRKRDFKVCRRICKRAARLAEKAKTSLRYESLLPLVYLTLGDIYREWGREERDHTRARKWYNDALKRVGSNLYQQERIRVALADVACALNDSVGALRQYEEAIRIQNQIGDAYGLAMSFGGVGGLLVEQENYEEGRYYCEEAYKYQQLIGDLGRFWRTSYSLTKIYCHKKEWEKAIEYWSQARPVLFGQHRFSRLSSKERGDIYNLVCELADYFRKNNRLEEHLMFAQDKEEAAPSNDRNELAGVRIEIGEASFKVRDWPAAVAAFTEALELTNTAMVRAEIYEWLGDIYTVYDTPARAVSADDSNNLKGQAESCYEKAVTQLICINNIPRALAAYRKLLRQVMTDEAGMWQFPLTFLHILQVTPFSIGVHDQFVEETLDLLLKNEKPGEAGDILVYTARIAAREDDAVIPREKKLYYLERAEETYRLGSKEDLIWGLNMLIPSYFRIELWDSIIRCFEELFELYFEVEGSKVEDILGTFKAISVFKDAITPDQLEHFIALALDGPKRIAFTSSEEKHLFLYVAKTYSHIAYKVVAEEARRNEDLALEYFDKARASASPDDPLITTVLNDSALIYEHRGEHEEALKRLDEAILMHKQFGLSSAGACYCNRAMIYIDLGRRKEARDDFEQALEYESKDSEHWDARLKNQDERPLSLAEIRQMHHDKESLGITCRSFANLLLGEGEDLEMAHELALRAKRLFEEINRPDAAKAAGFIGDLTEVMVSDGSLVEKLIELRGRLHTSEFLQPLNESGYVCPSCQLPLDTGVVSVRCPNCAQQFCSECKSVVGDGAPECSECGQALCSECGFKVHGEDEKCFARQTLLPSCCVKCGSNIDPDHAQCPQCGGSFNAGDVTVISI